MHGMIMQAKNKTVENVQKIKYLFLNKQFGVLSAWKN